MEIARGRTSPLVHCPYCKDGFPVPREVIACAACGARHHLDCYRELLCCASCSATDMLSHREGLDRLAARRTRDRARSGAVVTLVLAGLVATSAGGTFLATVAWIETRPSVIEKVRAEHVRTDTDADRVARERGLLAEEREDWTKRRDNARVEIEGERERVRANARAGWSVAEHLARATPGFEDARVHLKEALALVPLEHGDLRAAIAGKIADEEEHLARAR